MFSFLFLREENLQPHIVSVEKLYKDSSGEQVRIYSTHKNFVFLINYSTNNITIYCLVLTV